MTTLQKAWDLAKALTDMATTGEDFLAGHTGEEIVIERYLPGKEGKELVDQMTVDEAIAYTRVFAIDGATKCQMALEFLVENDTDANQLVFVNPPLKRALRIIKEAT